MATKQENTALIEHLLKTIGRLVVNAAVCDLILFSTFKVISGCESKIASAIYFSSETLNAKTKFIRRILDANKDQTEKTIVGHIVDATENAQKPRNELSHANVQVSPDGKKLLRLNARHQAQPGTQITGPYLSGLLKRSTQAHIAALRAYQELCQKRGIPPVVSHE